MSLEDEGLPKMEPTDSMLFSDNMGELVTNDSILESEPARDVYDVHKSLENIYLDEPSYTADIDASSITSRNESLMNLQMFDDDADLSTNAEKQIETNVTDITNQVGSTPGEKAECADSDMLEQIEKDAQEVVSDKREVESEGVVEVGFEEIKSIKKLPTTDSTKSLMNFFIDSPIGGGADVEGKHFFDSFTTVQNDEVPPTKTGEQETTSGSQVRSPIETPLATAALADAARVSMVSEERSQISFEVQNQQTISPNLERSHDAWLPSEKTRQSLLKVLYNGTNVIVPFPTSQLTMPGVIIEESLGDPIRDLLIKYIGESEANKRLVLTADSVPQNQIGLQQLIRADCLRAAVDLTSLLLSSCGQGPGKMSRLSTHTPHSLQLWFCRLSLLTRLGLYGPSECEWQPFGELDNPDLFYEFHQTRYPGKKGSMVPFEMRISHAEFPQHAGRHQESLDRLYSMLFVVTKMITNLESGLLEDGSAGEMLGSEREECLTLWLRRERRILYCVANCLLAMKDHNNCLKILKLLLMKDVEHQRDIHSAMGRVYLQVGDIARAEMEFSKITPPHPNNNDNNNNNREYNIQKLMNKAFVEVGQLRNEEAMQSFKKIHELDDKNLIALNNMCVCALYLEKLKESLKQLELLVYTNPKLYLQETIVLNLCTLYELESSKANIKKQNLLRLIGQHRGTGFDASCLKLS